MKLVAYIVVTSDCAYGSTVERPNWFVTGVSRNGQYYAVSSSCVCRRSRRLLPEADMTKSDLSCFRPQIRFSSEVQVLVLWLEVVHVEEVLTTRTLNSAQYPLGLSLITISVSLASNQKLSYNLEYVVLLIIDSTSHFSKLLVASTNERM